MALRFRCERCGKRLQVFVAPLTTVMCPHCRCEVTVPVEAEVHEAEAPGPAAGAEGRPAAAGRVAGDGPWADQEPPEETVGDRAVALVATYLPTWGTSVVLHMSVVLVALMGAWVVAKTPESFDYTATARVEMKPNFTAHADLATTRMRMPNTASHSLRKFQTELASSFVIKRSNNLVADVAANNLDTTELLGAGGGGRDLGGMSGWGLGRGGGGGGPEFYGIGGFGTGARQARRVVYVIDKSGSMTDTMMYVKHELRRSIGKMKPNCQFYPIFYSTGPAVEMSIRQLLPAVETNKNNAFEFIDGIVPFGQTDPSDALKRAFELQPDLIYLLSDGEFSPNIVKLIDKLNPDRKVAVHTICFVYTVGEAMLMEIAQKNGGQYRYVGEVDLDNLGR